jgi:hypothetical protein
VRGGCLGFHVRVMLSLSMVCGLTYWSELLGKKKKKKKSTKQATDDAEGEDGAVPEAAPAAEAESSADYKYDFLLDRVFSFMRQKNPEMVAGEKKQMTLKPPQVCLSVVCVCVSVCGVCVCVCVLHLHGYVESFGAFTLYRCIGWARAARPLPTFQSTARCFGGSPSTCRTS